MVYYRGRLRRRRRYRRFNRRYIKGKSRYGGRKWFKRKLRANRVITRQFVPDRYFTKLHYSDYSNVSDALSPGGMWNYFNYRGNSLFDPDEALGGTQPYAFDQLAAMYASYRVYACKIRVKIHSLGPGNNSTLTQRAPFYVGIFPYTTDSTPPADAGWIENMTERPFNRIVTQNSMNHSPQITSTMSTAKIFGLPKVAVKTGPGYDAPVTTNPVSEWFWRVCFGQLNVSSQDSQQYALEVRLTYYCEFFSRKQLPKS